LDITIADFGLATYINKSKYQLSWGTFGFIAPEILNSKQYYCKVDIFSAGAVLFYMLSGK
jgi:serine/threonine protein kinase